MPQDLRGRLEELIPSGDRLLLDTTVFVSYFGGGDRWSEASRELIGSVMGFWCDLTPMIVGDEANDSQLTKECYRTKGNGT